MGDTVPAMERLVAAIPGAEAVLSEHLEDNDEIVPHLLMADLRRMFVALVESGSSARQISGFLDAIEALAASDDEDVRNVVEVSFIEDLVLGDEERERAAIEAMRPLVGPATARSLAVSEHYYPPDT